MLGEFGSDLSHAIRLDQYYPVPRAVASYHLARHAEFGDYIPPSTSVVMERCFAAGIPPGSGIEIRKQTEFLILEKLRTALEAAGSSLEQSLKAQIYLANIEDAPDCLDAWNQYYAGIPCAVTVVPTKSFATVGGIVEINLIALTNGAARKKQVVETDIPGMAAYGPCIKVGEFLLPSGLIAIGRDGHIAGRTISPGFAGLAHAGHIQAEAIYDYAEALCQAAGTTMAKLLRAQYFVADVAVFPGVAMAWSTRFGRQPHPFVCVQTPTSMPAPGTAVIADFWISTLQ